MGINLIKKKVSFGFITGGISIAVNGLVGLAILPILLKFLSKEIAGLWVFFVSFNGLVLLSQAGLAPVITRFAASLKTGNFNDDRRSNYLLLLNNAYRLVLILVFLVCVSLYSFYIYPILVENNFLFQGTITWFFLTIGYIFQLYFIRYLHTINGLGEVGWDKVLQIIVSILNLFGYFLVLKLFTSFIGLGLVYLTTSILFAVGAKLLFRKYTVGFLNTNPNIIIKKELFHLFKEGGKIFILNITGFIVMQANLFILEAYKGLAILPAYSGLMKITSLIISISLLLSQMIYPFIAQLWASRDYKKLYKIYIYNVLISVSIGTVLSTVIYFLAPYLVPLWLGKDNFLGNSIFIYMLIFAIIYIHHSAHANSVIATGKNTFVVPAVINGVLAFPSALLGMKYWGIKGMLIGTILATILPSVYVVQWSVRFFNKSVKFNNE